MLLSARTRTVQAELLKVNGARQVFFIFQRYTSSDNLHSLKKSLKWALFTMKMEARKYYDISILKVQSVLSMSRFQHILPMA
jgi:hypothetical protein